MYFIAFVVVVCIDIALYVAFIGDSDIVYTHFFYVPVLLAAIWYRKKAVYAALLLSAVYLFVIYYSLNIAFSPASISTGAVIVMVAYIVGMVSEKQALAEEALNKERIFSENVINTVPDSLLILDKDFKLKDANRSFYEMFKATPQEMIGKSITEILKDTEGKLTSEIEKVFTTHTIMDNFEFHYHSEKLGEKIFNARAMPLIHSLKNGLLMVEDITGRREREGLVMVQDITEKKRLLKEVEHARELQLKEQFISHVSHELRTPLTAIHEFTTILSDGLAGDLTDDQKEYVGVVLKNVRELKSMIDDLLEVTLAEAGRLTVAPKTISLTDLINDTVRLLQPSALSRNITLSSEIPQPLPTVYADPMGVRQILTNLIDNALKFTSSGGSIDVRAQTHTNGFVSVSITDTGYGISMENKERIFEYLSHEGEKLQSSRQGLGLGLYISKLLVIRQGGTIWVDSIPGKGSTFSFTLPVAAPQT